MSKKKGGSPVCYFEKEFDENDPTLVFNVPFVSKYSDLWDVNDSEIGLFLMKEELDVLFYKTPEVKDGYKVFVLGLENDANKTISLYLSMKFGFCELKNKKTGFFRKLNFVYGDDADSLRNSVSKDLSNFYEKKSKEIIRGIPKDIKTLMKPGSIPSRIILEESEKNTLFYEVAFPFDHTFIKSYNPFYSNIDFYYLRGGLLHHLESELVEAEGCYFKFKLLNLESSTIYPCIHISLDRGSSFLPSLSMFGTTLSESNSAVTLLNSKLPPVENDTGVYFFNFPKTVDFLGKDLAKEFYKPLVFKTEQEEDPSVKYDEADRLLDKYLNLWFGGKNE